MAQDLARMLWLQKGSKMRPFLRSRHLPGDSLGGSRFDFRWDGSALSSSLRSFYGFGGLINAGNLQTFSLRSIQLRLQASRRYYFIVRWEDCLGASCSGFGSVFYFDFRWRSQDQLRCSRCGRPEDTCANPILVEIFQISSLTLLMLFLGVCLADSTIISPQPPPFLPSPFLKRKIGWCLVSETILKMLCLGATLIKVEKQKSIKVRLL